MKLGQYAVHLTDSAGVLCSFLPGDEVPDWAVRQLGPHCFAEPTVSQPEPVESHTTHPAAGGPPPRSGRGSGEGQWRQYAQDHGVDVTLVEGRDDIIAACEAAGIAVE